MTASDIITFVRIGKSLISIIEPSLTNAYPHPEPSSAHMTDWTRSCPDPSEEHAEAARRRQASLTKPHGALGRLENIAIELAALQRTERPKADRVEIIVFAGDHGVTSRSVSAYPSTVTVEMLRNFTAGGAAISVLARTLGARLEVVDAGSFATAPILGVMTDKPRAGTRDFSRESALTQEEVAFAMAAGARAIARSSERRPDLIVLGEMGIGNTTSAAAMASAMLRLPPAEVVGPGTGLDELGLARKIAAVAEALALHRLTQAEASPWAALQFVGGLEIAALTGAIIASAQRSIPILVDGFIVSVAALAACRINASVRPWLLFAHRSAERGHAAVLAALQAEPILDLGLRLGEGSGAAVAVPILRMACALHNEMATFDEASVSGRMV